MEANKLESMIRFIIREELVNLYENSKNEPIPELRHLNKKLCILMLGTPGIGKSTYVKNHILPKNNTFKIIDPDAMTYTMTKNPSVHDSRFGGIAMDFLLTTAKQGTNIIYDVSGNSVARIEYVFNFLKNEGYTIIFIHLLSDFNTISNQNSSRQRKVPIEYLTQYYKNSQKLIQYYSKLPYDNYYVVTLLNNKYKYYKYENGHLLRHKNDKYA